MISKELLSELGYGKVTYIGDIVELYTMDCLQFKCDVTRESGRGDDKFITTNTSFHIALEVLANKCKNWIKSKGFCINILDRPNGLLDLKLSYGIDFDYHKNFSYKIGINGHLPQEIGAIFAASQWVLNKKE